jgi:4-hydroxy-3-polyprenylbenzoate decarboxylase
MPPAPAFYARPKTLQEMVDHTVGRALDHFGVDLNLVRRWGEKRASRTRRDFDVHPGDIPEEAT